MSRTSLFISGLAAVALVGGLAYWVLSEDKTDQTLVPIPASSTQDKSANAIANQWQWENFTDTKRPPKSGEDEDEAHEDASAPTGDVPFDVVQIYNILQDIEIDENGQVVPDRTVKNALEKGFDDLGPDLSPESMAELQELIRIGLPGAAGEEAARIFEDYYRMRIAEEKLIREMEKQGGQATAAERHEQRMALRRRYLGNDVANELFALEDAQANHIIATMEIQKNDDLSEEEKQAKLAALQDTFHNRLLDMGEMQPEQLAAAKVERLKENGASSAEIYTVREQILGPVKAQELAAADREEAQWESRFEQYWQARQTIMQASVSDAEKERQIEQLLNQYFTPEERDRARRSTYKWQTREQE